MAVPPPREESVPRKAKAVPHRGEDDLPSTLSRNAREYWNKLNDLFYRTLGHAEKAKGLGNPISQQKKVCFPLLSPLV